MKTVHAPSLQYNKEGEAERLRPFQFIFRTNSVIATERSEWSKLRLTHGSDFNSEWSKPILIYVSDFNNE